MKHRAVERICKNAKILHIYDRVYDGEITEQWVGDGAAAYPMWGMAIMDAEQYLCAFDVPEGKRDGWGISRAKCPEDIVRDVDPNEEEIRAHETGVFHGGKDLLLFDTSEGVMAMDRKYLAPIMDCGLLSFYKRGEGKGRYFAVKNGMVVVAVIYPVAMQDETLPKALRRMADQIEAAQRIEKAPYKQEAMPYEES